MAASETVTVVLAGPVQRADIAAICERARARLEASDAAVLACDVRALADHDAVAADALVRLALTARRLGRRVRVRHASPALEDLLAWTGLGLVLTACGELRLEAGRQAEEREEGRGVEEEARADDPTV